ncbi:MAG: DUF3575 domain-containing protein [Bacteroides intestinalis]
MKKILVCILFILGLLPAESKAQKIAVKSNLLYDATTTMNLGLEVALARKWTLDIPVNYNPWKFDETRLKHWGIQPELRYWFCESFNRTFIGLHGHYADFNVGGLPDWPLMADLRNYELSGTSVWSGVSIGHSWILKKRWSIEASLGLGYARIVYEKYPCATCGTKQKDTSKNYVGPTKASVSLIYVIK